MVLFLWALQFLCFSIKKNKVVQFLCSVSFLPFSFNQEIMKETMERVPLMKEIVDHYSGPDRVTAKQQQEELERVARSVPVSAPDSVKRFADRAVLSLKVSIFPYHLEISYYFHTLHKLLLLEYCSLPMLN